MTATTPAIAAMTIPIGDVSAPRMPGPAFSAPPTAPRVVLIVPIVFLTVPMTPITLPTPVRSGPIAAATNAILMMTFWIPGLSPFHAFAALPTAFETVSSPFSSVGPNASTNPAPTPASLFPIVWNLSIGSRVSSNVSETFPSVSLRSEPVPIKSSAESVPL